MNWKSKKIEMTEYWQRFCTSWHHCESLGSYLCQADGRGKSAKNLEWCFGGGSCQLCAYWEWWWIHEGPHSGTTGQEQPDQFRVPGPRKRSTRTNLLQYLERFTDMLDKDESFDIHYLDFATLTRCWEWGLWFSVPGKCTLKLVRFSWKKIPKSGLILRGKKYSIPVQFSTRLPDWIKQVRKIVMKISYLKLWVVFM